MVGHRFNARVSSSSFGIACAATVLLACKGADPSGGSAGDGSGESTSTSAESESSEGSGEADTGTNDGQPKLDVGAELDLGTGGMGCENVDFLFVIDNSSSMEAEQDAMIAAFPQFITTIQDTLQGQDYNIMVVDSDDDPTYACEVENNCMSQFHCEGYTCDDVDMLDECDLTLGGGVVRPYGGLASNVDCGVMGEDRFMTDMQPDLSGTFGCAAKVGISGSRFEMPLSSMEAAISPAFIGPGGCNEGFVRDDAILVVTVISDDPATDMDDDAKNADPVALHDALVAAKDGNEDAIVVLGLFADGGGMGCPEAPAPFKSFVETFGDNGIIGDVCSVDFAEFFQSSVSTIDTICDEFEPAG